MSEPGASPSVEPVASPTSRSAGGPHFAHASEAELARILDFYAVTWQYEPHVFPILWNLDGAVVESFSPDFYLPDFDTYLELTTLRQPLVRKKNRKLRRLRELYPDIRIKLFYARDFRALMLKYGKLGLVDALSGTSGQVVPAPHVVPAKQVEAAVSPAALAGQSGPSRAADPAGAVVAGATSDPRNADAGATGRVPVAMSAGPVPLVTPAARRARRRRRRATAQLVALVAAEGDA